MSFLLLLYAVETYGVVLALSSVSEPGGNLGHCLDPNNTLNGKVCLICQRTSEIVRANLACRD